MPILTIRANAKLNLTLDVLGRRADGYHDLCMVMTSVALADVITLEIGTGSGVQVSTNLSFLPTGEKNLAASALLRFQEATGLDLGGARISLEKSIPVCAGMGGGSSDAAAVLRAVNQLAGAGLDPMSLAKIGQAVGSDVPYCVLGGTVLAEGRGEVLTPLSPLPPCVVVVCKPNFSISTPELFRKIDKARLRHHPDTEGMVAALEAGDLSGVARRVYNVFEDVLHPRQQSEVAEIKYLMVSHGALGASMSGTGPTVFGLFENMTAAQAAVQELRAGYRYTFLTQTV